MPAIVEWFIYARDRAQESKRVDAMRRRIDGIVAGARTTAGMRTARFGGATGTIGTGRRRAANIS